MPSCSIAPPRKYFCWCHAAHYIKRWSDMWLVANCGSVGFQLQRCSAPVSRSHCHGSMDAPSGRSQIIARSTGRAHSFQRRLQDAQAGPRSLRKTLRDANEDPLGSHRSSFRGSCAQEFPIVPRYQPYHVSSWYKLRDPMG